MEEEEKGMKKEGAESAEHGVTQYLSHLQHLHAEILVCRLCSEAGYFAQSSDIVVSAHPALPRMMLVGQAPASPVRSKGVPFSGQAGRVLFSWLARAGFSESDFRTQCYFTAITKCYPGPARGERGSGDRAPSSRERDLCRPFLLRELALIQPSLILAVGRLSTTYFLGPGIDFTAVIGASYVSEGRTILPLPHPSGVSRWTNIPANRLKLDAALAWLAGWAKEKATGGC